MDNPPLGQMTHAEIIAHAMGQHPDCKYGDWDNGMAFPFTLTRVVKLWRNEECYLAGDEPKYIVEGYPRYLYGDEHEARMRAIINGTDGD